MAPVRGYDLARLAPAWALILPRPRRGMEQRATLADVACDAGVSDPLDPPTIHTVLPILRHLDADGTLLSSMIYDPSLCDAYGSMDRFIRNLFRLIYWNMVEVKFIEDELEGDDHRLSMTDLGKATLRLHGG